MTRIPLRSFRLVPWFLVMGTAQLEAQESSVPVTVTASAVYARAFGGGGEGAAIQALRLLPVDLLGAEHSFGLSLWYARADIAGGAPFGEQRTLSGVGVQWQTRFSVLGDHVQPYLAAPLQIIFSRIPDKVYLTDRLQPATPASDRAHGEQSLSLGVGAGLGVNITSSVGFRIGVQRLYHRLFAAERTPVFLADVGLTIAFVEGR